MSDFKPTNPDVNWILDDYFENLLKLDGEEFAHALELMVDDLHRSKEKTVNRFLCHKKSDSFLFTLLKLLSNDNLRIAGNTAYILGCLAESQIGCYRLLSTMTSNKAFKVLNLLIRMLSVSDGETVMNAAGTIGTLAESKEGREWILNQDCLSELINYCSGLLLHENNWTGSNAALVLARLSISEQGCSHLAGHPGAGSLVGRLCGALGCDEAGRGMNAAFALGRITDLQAGAALVAGQPAGELDRMVASLTAMTACSASDAGAAKNACFCLSCLAGSEFGHRLVLARAEIAADLVGSLGRLVTGNDEETAWFAALALRILSSKPIGAKFLKGQTALIALLKSVIDNQNASVDLRDEVASTLEFIRPLEKPFPPMIEVRGCDELRIRWLPVDSKVGFPITYELHCDHGLVYQGDRTEHAVTKLSPATTYAFRLRVTTEADKSAFSETIAATTDEAAPSKPSNLRLLAATATQLKVAWDQPARGSVRTYLVYCDGRQVDCTTEQISIISSLAPSTDYNVQVCASSSKGRSERAFCRAATLELGAHAPPKPQVTVLGRHEMFVTWEPPEQPLGRINHYNVVLNGKRVAYSGTDMSCKVGSLTADTEYLVTVVVVTNEGKAESKPARKRTAKDEFDPQRQPLWAPTTRQSSVTAEATLQLTVPTMIDSAEVRPRRGSLAKIEPRALKPLKSDPIPQLRRSSLPPPVDSKKVLVPASQLSATPLAPTTLVLDRFGSEGGSRLRRVTSEEARATVHVTGWPTATVSALENGHEELLGQREAPVAEVPDSPLAAFSAAKLDLVETDSLSWQQPPPLQPPPLRVNARPELEPLPQATAAGDNQQTTTAAAAAAATTAGGPAGPAAPAKLQKRQRAKNLANRRSREPMWLQSRSLVESKLQATRELVSPSESVDPDDVEYRHRISSQETSAATVSSRTATDRFKANLALLSGGKTASSTPLVTQPGQHQQQQQKHRTYSQWQREAATTTGGSQQLGFNRQGTLLRMDHRVNRESSLMASRGQLEVSMKRNLQKLD